MVNDLLQYPMEITGASTHPGSANGCTHEPFVKTEPPHHDGVARRYLRKHWMLIAAKLRLDVFFNLMQLVACTQYATFNMTIKGMLFTILIVIMWGIVNHSGKL